MNVPQVSVRKILYTTNLSETGRYAFAYAASLSKAYNAKLSVMHVVDEEPELDPRLAGYMPKDLWQEIKTRDLGEAKQILLARQRDNSLIVGECVGQYCTEIQVGSKKEHTVMYDIVVQLGDPVQEIVSYAKENCYDLIVVGRHRHSSLQEVVYPNIARKIIRSTAIPVFVVQIPE
ncbi:MAG: universal stress protein [Desulfocapsa sp.]|nr:universal stress protein [Desulfocapsa sp.]